MAARSTCSAEILACNYLQPHDWIWLQKINDVVGIGGKTTRRRRYNSGQSCCSYLGVCLIGLLLSGIVIWRVYFAEFFSVVRFVRLAATPFWRSS